MRPLFASNEILVRMALDINSILSVSAVEKETGLSKESLIERAFRRPQRQLWRALSRTSAPSKRRAPTQATKPANRPSPRRPKNRGRLIARTLGPMNVCGCQLELS
ncbi:MAG: hypothetical protein CO108_00890 [Deltaproteobacteria bacterium CG_4_9_14_3_um_filter_63_12]|nr:MAG: hypothetical protein CO108_00890 [Deltaproteobacteria bacterium CG_4_9_14_3_um_filter_63_12]